MVSSGFPPQGVATPAQMAVIEGKLSPRTATMVVAASDSSPKSKAQADHVCTGTNDEVEIQKAIAALPT